LDWNTVKSRKERIKKLFEVVEGERTQTIIFIHNNRPGWGKIDLPNRGPAKRGAKGARGGGGSEPLRTPEERKKQNQM